MFLSAEEDIVRVAEKPLRFKGGATGGGGYRQVFKTSDASSFNLSGLLSTVHTDC